MIWGGLPFFERGWPRWSAASLNMFTLIAMGTGTAYVFSLIAVLAPAIFPDSFRDHHGEVVPVYFEPAAAIVTLVLLGQVLELRARRQTGSAIRALLRTGAQDGATDSRAMVATKMSHSTRWSRAIGCGSARAKKFPSTAS